MSDKKKLKLLKPRKPCDHAPCDPKCEWWINSEKHDFFFWKYIMDKSDPDGYMQELTQAELADLFGWSNTKIHFVLKEATDELVEALMFHKAINLLKDMDSSDFENLVTSQDSSLEDELD